MAQLAVRPLPYGFTQWGGVRPCATRYGQRMALFPSVVVRHRSVEYRFERLRL